MVNMILGLSEESSVADLNNDDSINIQDIILLVNMILNGRSVSTIDKLGTNAIIFEENTSVHISANGQIAGIQMVVNSENLLMNENIPLAVNTSYLNEEYIILVYGISGETLSGDKIHLFTSNNYEIKSSHIVNIIGESMSVNRANELLPDTFNLSQNFPNPFNPNTSIQFTLGTGEMVSLNIFDIQGRLVNSLINSNYYNSGTYNLIWNGKNSMGIQVPSGMYFYKLVSKNYTLTKKMILMK